MSDTPKLDMPEIAESQSSKYITHNEALRILDAIVQCTVLSKDDIVPPVSPSDGDTYIVGLDTDSTSGDWEGHDSEIAYYKSSAWIFIVPAEGWRAYAQDVGIEYAYMSSKVGSAEDPWIVAPGSEYRVDYYYPAKPSGSYAMARWALTNDVNFPDDLAGSQGYCAVAATAETVFSIQKNGVEFATMTFAAAGQVATFATASDDMDCEAGDIISIVTPGSYDATCAQIAVSLLGAKL